MEYRHVMTLGSFKFYESWYSESRTLLGDVK